MTGAAGGWSFLGHQVPSSFVVRRVTLRCGATRDYDEAEWVDAIVVVESGSVELECSQGLRKRFSRGAILWLQGLPLRALHCCGQDEVVLLAVSRRPTDEVSFPRRSNGETATGGDEEAR